MGFKYFRNGRINNTHYLTVPELSFRLSFKLRLGDFYGYDRTKPLAEIIPLDLNFCFIKHALPITVTFKNSRQCPAKTGNMSATFNRIDIIYVRINVFAVTIVIIERYFNGNICSFILSFNKNDLWDQRIDPHLHPAFLQIQQCRLRYKKFLSIQYSRPLFPGDRSE